MALMEQLFAGIGYFVYEAMPATVVAHYPMEVFLYLCMKQKWTVLMGRERIMAPLSLPIHTVSGTIPMGTREHNKLHLKIGQMCLNKLEFP